MCVFDIFGAASSQGGDIEHPMGDYAAVWSMFLSGPMWKLKVHELEGLFCKGRYELMASQISICDVC